MPGKACFHNCSFIRDPSVEIRDDTVRTGKQLIDIQGKDRSLDCFIRGPGVASESSQLRQQARKLESIPMWKERRVTGALQDSGNLRHFISFGFVEKRTRAIYLRH
jgi:hypothetical protein